MVVNTSANKASTQWVAIWALFLSSCTLALHVGKFPAALPLLVDEFSLSLAQTGNLVSVYALLIAFCAIFVGVSVVRVGYVEFAIAGVGLCTFGSFCGAFATADSWLMVTRIFEGLGWLVGIVAFPALMGALAVPKDRPVVMGLLAAFMPIGTSLMLFLAPFFHSMGGWRFSWLFAAIVSFAGLAATIVVCRQQRVILNSLEVGKADGQLRDLMSRQALAILLCFFCYSFQYVSLLSYLPTLLIQESGLEIARASYWAAFIVLCNAIGNVSAGWLLKFGFKHHQILATAAVLMGIAAWVALSFPSPPIRISAALLLTAVGGLIPGTLFTTSTLLASTTAGAGIVVGFMLTGAGFGQFLGPIALTRVVEWSGHWSTGGVMNLLIGLSGACFALWLRRLRVAGDAGA